MLLKKSLIILVTLFVITMSMSLPTNDKQTKQHKRPKRKSDKNRKNKKAQESDCVHGFCANVTSYPTEEVNKLLKENALPGFYMKQYESPLARFTFHQEHLCDILTRTLLPKRAASRTGTKEYVVQTDNQQQIITLEVCQGDEPKLIDRLGCLPNGYAVSCEQQYRIIPLMVYDEKSKSIKLDEFKVPSACGVHFSKMH